MLGLNVNFSQPSVNRYKKQKNLNEQNLNKFSNTKMVDTVSFGTNLPLDELTHSSNLFKSLAKLQIPPRSVNESTKTFFGNTFMRYNVNTPKYYVSVADLPIHQAEKLVRTGQEWRDMAREALGKFKPEQFDDWVQRLISSDKYEGEFHCVTPEAETTAVSFKRYHNSVSVSTTDSTGRMSDDMRNFIVSLKQKNPSPRIIKAEDGSKWELNLYSKENSKETAPTVILTATKLLD